MKTTKFRLKGRQILLVGLVALVITAGYYRWTVEKPGNNSIAVTSDATPTKTTQKDDKSTNKNAGKTESTSDSSLTKSKQNRDTNRSAAIAELKKVTTGTEASAEVKAEAEKKIKLSAINTEKEGKVETLVKAKGFNDCFAMIDDKGITVMVSGKKLDSALVAQIKDIIVSQTEIPTKDIKISENS